MPDTSPPALSGLTPVQGATGVALDAVLTFSVLDPAEGGAVGDTSITDPYPVIDPSPAPDGVATVFTVEPYEPGTLTAWVDGIEQEVDEVDPDAGEFSVLDDAGVAWAPLTGAVIVTDSVEQWRGNFTDITTLIVKIEDEVIFSAGEWSDGYDGTVEPVLGGYEFVVDTHPDLPSDTQISVAITAQDVLGNATTLYWTFNTVAVYALDSVSPSSVEDDGGYVLTLLGQFGDEPVTVAVVVGGNDLVCYSGKSGDGNGPSPRLGGTKLTAVTPPLAIGGPYDVKVTVGVSTVTLAAALTSNARQWKERTHALRRLFPPWYRMGPRTLESVDLLT